MKKSISLIICIIVIASAGYVGAVSIGLAQNPVRVNDPDDPNFDPDSFSFNLYKFDREAKIEYFKKLFPIGTSKEFVDRVLVQAGGAKPLEIKEMPEGWQVWRYDGPDDLLTPGGPTHTFIFKADKLDNIQFSNIEYLYQNQTTKEILREIYAKDRRRG